MDFTFGHNLVETSPVSVVNDEFETSIWGADAHEVWKALRDAGPVVRPNPAMVVVTTTESVTHVLRDPKVFSSNPSAGYFGSETGAIPLQIDPPAHSGYRKVLDPLFTPTKMAAKEAEIAAVANEFIDAFIDRGACDFARDFAVPFPSAVFLKLMGLPYDNLSEFLRVKEALIRPHGATEDDRNAVRGEMGAWIYNYFNGALDASSGDPKQDILGHFVALEREGRLSRDEVLNTCLLLLAAGLDTVTDTLENAYAFLARNPSHQRQLADNPQLATAAIEELLRYDTPVPTVSRVTMVDTEITGCPVAAGQKVLVLLPNANHDPAIYGNPDDVDFERKVNPHMAFGAGVHRCLGSHLARVELRVALREWHRRIPSYRLADGATLSYRVNLREIDHLPLVF
jgi:cytochrome P450